MIHINRLMEGRDEPGVSVRRLSPQFPRALGATGPGMRERGPGPFGTPAGKGGEDSKRGLFARLHAAGAALDGRKGKGREATPA